GRDAFVYTAAVMENLDLVITSDTSIAHLAGALARPVWIVLKHVPDWRWLLDRKDSPWYPTARLFRQTTNGDWTAVFSEIANELQSLLPISDFHASASQRLNVPSVRPFSVSASAKEAIAWHQAGKLEEAESLYREILDAQP